MVLLTGVNDHGRRLDRILRKAMPRCPLALIHKLLRQGKILVNGKPASPQTRVAKGSKISIPKVNTRTIAKKTLSGNREQGTGNRIKNTQPLPQVIPNTSIIKINKKSDLHKDKLNVKFYRPPEVLWQDFDLGLIAFNKPAGLAVHGQVSLDRMVQAYLTNKIEPSLSFKPGPLHRLDKPSSGIIVFSVSLEGANLFTKLMKEHKIKKTYLAIVEGTISGKCYWTDYLTRNREMKKSFIIREQGTGNREQGKEGKIAITIAIPLATSQINGKPYTLIEAEIETGRTHQIRAQSSFHGHPLAGDRKYSGHKFYQDDIRSAINGGFFLHAWKLEFEYNNVNYKIEAPLPDEFKKLVETVFSTTPSLQL